MIEPARIEGFHRDLEVPLEPVKLWVFADTLRCAIYPSGLGMGFNGYVQLPEGSVDRVLAEAYNDFEHNDPDRRDRRVLSEPGFIGYDILHDIDVHGGLTFGPDEAGWIGFDTGHAWDIWAQEELQRVLLPDNREVWLKLLELQLILGEDAWPPGRISQKHRTGMEIDWTLERVEAETNHLAAQVYERLRGVQQDVSTCPS